MAFFGKKAPAHLRRAFFVAALLNGTTIFSAAPAAKVDSFTAAQILEQVRSLDIPGDSYWEFELHALPRRGEEKVYKGRTWSGHNDQGANSIKRIELDDGSGRKIRLLLQNGARSAVWRKSDGPVALLGTADLFVPLLPGLELTAFDLQMPFLYWPNATLERVQTVRGRAAHVFVFRPPPDFAAQNSQVAAGRIFVDTQLSALVQAELLDKDNRVLKRFSPLSLKTVERQTLPKTVDFRNEATGDKARLEMTAVAMGLTHPATLFQPATLEEDIRPPAAKLVRID